MPSANVVLTAIWEAEGTIAPVLEPEAKITTPATTQESPTNVAVTATNQVVAAAIEQGIPVLDIFGGQVPLYKPADTNTWSFFDLLATVLALIALLVVGVFAINTAR
jgi:hypothetical protein